MTREEFAKGWLLLVVQPWGRPYADDSPTATVQREVYYRELATIDARTWQEFCARCAATAKEWPSLDTVRGWIAGPDTHPGVEEAWSIVGPSLNDEGVTVVWTDQIAEAFASAVPLANDPIAARMAFKETYTGALIKARMDGTKPRWWASLGWDKNRREPAIQAAVDRGRLTQTQAQKLLPEFIGREDAERIVKRLGMA
jgi:hypothetical protein